MSIRMNPYLVMDGNGKEAIRFYEQALGAKVMGVVTFGEMPASPDHPLPDAAKDLVAHAMLQVGEGVLMLSDSFPGQPVQKGDNVAVMVSTADVAQSRKIFEALSEGGKVGMPFQETSWSPGYGMVTDKFGVPFQVNTDSPR